MVKLFAEQSCNVARDVFRQFRAFGGADWLCENCKRSRAGEERKPLAIAAAVSDGVQGKPDWHDAFMGFAHAARKAAEKSSHSIDLLAIVPDALSQDDRDTFAGFGFTVLPRPPFVPLKEVENAFGSSEMLKGCCGAAENLKLYASELVDYDPVLVLDGDVMLLGSLRS